MSGTRRVQRSIRISVASSLLSISTVLVFFAVATATWVSAAAICALVAGAAASRIVYSEVIQTRAEAARDRAAQARAFGEAISQTQDEHAEFVTLVSTQIADRNRTIRELTGTVRLTELRAAAAEQRVKRESRRANDAQERLASLLDGVLAQRDAERRHEIEAEMESALAEATSRLWPQPHRTRPATKVEPSSLARR